MAVLIEYWGHSCFRITAQEHSLVLDPYPADMAGYAHAAPSGGAVYCSHEHFDHNCREAVEIVAEEGATPFSVTAIDTWHDEVQGQKRGVNKVYLIEVEGKRIVHLGDLGHLLTEQQLTAMGRVDALMIPVGGCFTIDGEQAAALCRALQPRVILPMHYREGNLGFEQISEIHPFLSGMAEFPVICCENNSYLLEEDGEGVIIKLAYCSE